MKRPQAGAMGHLPSLTIDNATNLYRGRYWLYGVGTGFTGLVLALRGRYWQVGWSDQDRISCPEEASLTQSYAAYGCSS